MPRGRKAKPLETATETYDCALNLMSFRDHSHKELSQKLTRRGANKEQVEESLEKLTEYGILDDERYAQRVYEAWLAKRVYGRQHLQAELSKRGVPQQYCAPILEQFTDALEAERAELAAEQFCKLNRRKIVLGMASSDPKDRQKLYAAAGRYLATRGFGGGYMELVLEKLKAAVQDSEENFEEN